MRVEALLVVALIGAGIVAWLLFARARTQEPDQGPTVTLAQVAAVYRALEAEEREGSFAVLLFGENGAPPKDVDALNVQFSVEQSRPGLDWVLLAPENVAARSRVTAFLEGRGYEVEERDMNGVSYLRIEGEDLPETCKALLAEIFGVQQGQKLHVIPEGFTWPA